MEVRVDATEHVIAAGHVVERFLADDSVVALFAEMEADYIREWRRAETPAAREDAHAELCAFERFQKKLKVVAERGRTAQQKLDSIQSR